MDEIWRGHLNIIPCSPCKGHEVPMVKDPSLSQMRLSAISAAETIKQQLWADSYYRTSTLWEETRVGL